MIHVSVPLTQLLAELEHQLYMSSEQAAVDYCNELVDGAGRTYQVDKVRSVSALSRVEATAASTETNRRSRISSSSSLR